MGQLTYKDEEGGEVKKAQFLRNRGSCCKTACRHCPYGFTLREKGLQFADYSDEWRSLAEKLIAEQSPPQHGLAASLLAEGIGPQLKAFNLMDYPSESLRFILLKGRKIGLIAICGIQVSKLFLDQHYRDQGIDIPTVESFYF